MTSDEDTQSPNAIILWCSARNTINHTFSYFRLLDFPRYTHVSSIKLNSMSIGTWRFWFQTALYIVLLALVLYLSMTNRFPQPATEGLPGAAAASTDMALLAKRASQTDERNQLLGLYITDPEHVLSLRPNQPLNSPASLYRFAIANQPQIAVHDYVAIHRFAYTFDPTSPTEAVVETMPNGAVVHVFSHTAESANANDPKALASALIVQPSVMSQNREVNGPSEIKSLELSTVRMHGYLYHDPTNKLSIGLLTGRDGSNLLEDGTKVGNLLQSYENTIFVLAVPVPFDDPAVEQFWADAKKSAPTAGLARVGNGLLVAEKDGSRALVGYYAYALRLATESQTAASLDRVWGIKSQHSVQLKN